MIAIIILKIYNKKNYEKFIIIFLKFWYIYMSVYIIQIYFNSVQTMSLKTSQSITLHLYIVIGFLAIICQESDVRILKLGGVFFLCFFFHFWNAGLIRIEGKLA